MRALLVLLLVGCSTPTVAPVPDASPVCGLDYLGDRTKDIDFTMSIVGEDAIDRPIKDGDDVPLVLPPQGGRVVFVGVRATNLDPCAVQLTGAIRDMSTKQVRVDSRTINLIPDGKGYGSSGSSSQSINAAVSSYSNIPVCPNQWASANVFDTQYELEVTLKDHDKRTMTKTLHVTPRCVEPSNVGKLECQCICQVNYVLGQLCVADGGLVTDASDQ